MARALTWRDLAALPHLQKQIVFLDNVLRLTYNPGIFSSSLLSILASSSGFCTIVNPIESDRYPFLIGQAFQAPEDHSARVTFLAPGDLDHEGYADLLAYLAARVGETGALQILAEIDLNSLEHTILSRAGFRAYAEQQIWKLPRRFLSRSGKNAWIPIARADADQVIATCQRLVPPQIQRVENPPLGYAQQGMLCWKEGKIAGVAFTNFGPTGILIDLVIEPDLDALDNYLGTLFHHLPYRNYRDIFLRVRSYQQRLASALERAGASPGPIQKAVVKRLAVYYNAKQTFQVQSFEKQPDVSTPISNTKNYN
jgi:hypothetical protein